ncbi:hypothetical protein PIB30_010446 [Stylosanthes scabra]|uniref:Uncharacterized protein n=1 Tax=Stylosanthes scabra TaxID=79078 RepID=A0ABU6Y3J2_9FABA|nr:hypothetical protein [Stylosanthes scabra]
MKDHPPLPPALTQARLLRDIIAKKNVRANGGLLQSTTPCEQCHYAGGSDSSTSPPLSPRLPPGQSDYPLADDDDDY